MNFVTFFVYSFKFWSRPLSVALPIFRQLNVGNSLTLKWSASFSLLGLFSHVYKSYWAVWVFAT